MDFNYLRNTQFGMSEWLYKVEDEFIDMYYFGIYHCKSSCAVYLGISLHVSNYFESTSI